jgi:hypothetical protein
VRAVWRSDARLDRTDVAYPWANERNLAKLPAYITLPGSGCPTICSAMRAHSIADQFDVRWRFASTYISLLRMPLSRFELP